ncbi:hypothetical protein [Rufibacter ruber]|uniref:hypothetical protein n=1 Tax=Rufibacter ruber TaxID=1783499 RepID=UPI000832E2F2|nr:hypothetical protein [Rufibacter ruber]
MTEFIKKSVPFYLSFLLLVFISCDKDKDPTKNSKLPEATQLGKNTIGFTLENEEVWVPYNKCGLMLDPCGKYSARVSYPMASRDGIDFSFSRDNGKGISSSLFFSTALAGTITSTGNKIDSLGVTFLEFDNGSMVEYGFPLVGSHFTVTKFDKVAQIISGEFHLVLKKYRSNEIITLSNGRFDFKFQACECD